jgi:hypothetical protein
MNAARRLRDLPPRARELYARAQKAPQLEAEVADLRARNVELERRIGEQELHANHLEQLLHRAEQLRARLEESGLDLDAAGDPAKFARWLTWRPPGHFYSPIPNLDELQKQAELLWPVDLPDRLPGIDLREKEQLATFAKVAKFARELGVPEQPTEPWRYYSDNVAYGVGDALTLHGMLRLIRPKRLIEIGSGHSSAMTLDTVEHFLGGHTELTFVEPYPELLEAQLRPGDRERITVVPTALQQVPLETFTALQDGDVLFIDSTHVLKTGSDVAWLYGAVLPSLHQGVWIHIHDMFYPFEYPKDWVMEGRAWSEIYLVHAFLAFNRDFEIRLFNHWLLAKHLDRIEAELPAMLANPGGALWLRRTGRSR